MKLWEIAAIGGGIYLLWKVSETSKAVNQIGNAAGPIGKVADGLSGIVDKGKELFGSFVDGFGGLSEVAGSNPQDGISQMSAGENSGWLWDKELGWTDNRPGYY